MSHNSKSKKTPDTDPIWVGDKVAKQLMDDDIEKIRSKGEMLLWPLKWIDLFLSSDYVFVKEGCS